MILSNKLEKLIIVVSSELVMTNPSDVRAGELVISNKLGDIQLDRKAEKMLCACYLAVLRFLRLLRLFVFI